MILQSISSYIVVDHIVSEENEEYIHFFTHVDQCLQVPKKWRSVIYTSKGIARLLALKNSAIPMKYFKIIEPNTPTDIVLKDGNTITVIMFNSSALRENVMFFFNSSKGNVFFTGPFTKYKTIIYNGLFKSIILKGIDKLYIDNAAISSVVPSSLVTAGREILDIKRKHPDLQIMLKIPQFGYEDLLSTLAVHCHLKLYVNELTMNAFGKSQIRKLFVSNPGSADIIVDHEPDTLEDIKMRFFKNEQITVKVLSCSKQLNNLHFSKIGLYQIHWTPHPSLFQVYAFIELTSPKEVEEIYPDGPAIPTFLKELCHKNICEICNKPIRECCKNRSMEIYSNKRNNGSNTSEEMSTSMSTDSMTFQNRKESKRSWNNNLGKLSPCAEDFANLQNLGDITISSSISTSSRRSEEPEDQRIRRNMVKVKKADVPKTISLNSSSENEKSNGRSPLKSSYQRSRGTKRQNRSSDSIINKCWGSKRRILSTDSVETIKHEAPTKEMKTQNLPLNEKINMLEKTKILSLDKNGDHMCPISEGKTVIHGNFKKKSDHSKMLNNLVKEKTPQLKSPSKNTGKPQINSKQEMRRKCLREEERDEIKKQISSEKSTASYTKSPKKKRARVKLSHASPIVYDSSES